MKVSYIPLKILMVLTSICSVSLIVLMANSLETEKKLSIIILISISFIFALISVIQALRSLKKVPESFVQVEMAKAFFLLQLILLFVLSFYLTNELIKEELRVAILTGITIYVFDLIAFGQTVKKYFGISYLNAIDALSFQAAGQVLIDGGKLEKLSAYDMVQNVDKYLNSFDAPSKIQIKLVILILQYIPLIFLSAPMTWMKAEKRVKFLEKHFLHSSGTLRDLIRGVTQLIYLTYYGDPRTWEITGYLPFEKRERFEEMKKVPNPDQIPVTIPKPGIKDIDTDICVIGSGAGGAVVAYELAKKTGLKVTIVERGKYFIPEKDFTNIEPEMIGKLYKDGGLQLTQNFDMSILQGECLGGTTVINNGICFRIPENILDKWESLGTKIDRKKLAEIYTEIEKNINAHPVNKEKADNGAFKLVEGAKKIGVEFDWLSTNFKECGGCGNCNLGCKYNRKMSMLLNYLPWAVSKGAEIVVETSVTKINYQNGKVSSLNCKAKSGANFRINAKHVIVSCGTIGSSAILKESGITKNVGSRISFNVASPLHAEFKETLNSYDGVQMCTYLKTDNCLIENTFNPPAASSLIMPGWFEKHFNRMLKYNNLATASPVVGSEPNGKLKKSLIGGYDVDYTISGSDFYKLKEGLKTISKVLLASGADVVYPSTFDGKAITNPDEVDSVIEEIKKPEDVTLSSAHPQGGNPMSDDPKIGAISSNFNVHGFENLYVADASIFPTSIDVNPMLTIMAMGHYAADVISEKLNSKQ
jgi:choline dehydrogenase-like flavoprotein